MPTVTRAVGGLAHEDLDCRVAIDQQTHILYMKLTRVPLLSAFRMVCTSYQVTPLTLLPVSTVAGIDTSYSYLVFWGERKQSRTQESNN